MNAAPTSPVASAPTERTAQTRAIERLEELLPLATQYTTTLAGEWNGFVLDEAHAIWVAESGIPRDFAALEIRDCIAIFRTNNPSIDDLDLVAFTDAAERLADHARPIGPAFLARMIRLLKDPTAACPVLRFS